MAKLTLRARAKLPDSAFAGPHRSFPVQDRGHAWAAMKLIGKAPASARPAIRSRAMAVLGRGKGR